MYIECNMRNYKKYNSLKKVIKVLLFLLFIVLYVICVFPSFAESLYVKNYIVNAFFLILSVAMLVRLYLMDDLDIFDPIVIIGLLYIALYFFVPLYDISVGKYTWYGYDLFSYGVKSSCIAFLGYVCFYIVYARCFKFHSKPYNTQIIRPTICNNIIIRNRSIIILVILLVYFVSLSANIFYLVNVSGNSLLYILTLGMAGGGNNIQKTTSSIGFISMLSYCTPAATLLYFEYGKSKFLKVLMFVPMVILQVARGFRFFVIQIAITFFSYYYLKHNKRPKLSVVAFFLIVVAIPVLTMTVFRDSIRSGSGMDLSIISFETLDKAIDATVWDNFRIYHNYHGMVGKIPSVYSYVYGRQMIIGTLIMMIPRIIWPAKLASAAGVDLSEIIGLSLEGTGQAYPNLGEYYYAFGIVGVILFMSIYGVYARYVKDRYKKSQDGLDIILYSVLLGSNLQLIIRGYFPSNFWYLVFSIIPIIIVRRIERISD